ncbi:unnamed protein product [Scytosiphon promiscuus]
MRLQRLLSVSFLLAPWDPALSFLHHVALPRSLSRSSCSKHDHDQHDRRKQAASSTTAVRQPLRAGAANTDARARTSGKNRARHQQSNRRSTGMRAPSSSDPETHGLGRNTADKKRGATASSPSSLTRSAAISSAAATAGVFLSLITSPRQASAAVAEAGGVTVESVAPRTADFDVGGVEAGDIKAKYMVGSDEVGVLFGDGPIGIKLGDNPLKASGVCRVYVTEVLTGSQAVRQANLRAGFGVAAVGGQAAEKLEPKEVAELIRLSPRPVEIVFRDPELLGQRLQAEADRKLEAAKQKKRKAAADAASPEIDSASTDTVTAVDTRSGGTSSIKGKGGSDGGSSGELRVTQVGKKPVACGTKTKAGDLIEFRYSARLANDLAVEFDSSDRRGTGQPYAIVLGNGDVVKGLDLSLFDMCVGERRKIEIPARLAYGRKGSKLFGIPPDDGLGSADVVFGVELVSINFSTNAKDVRDNFYTDDPCDAAAIAAGNSSGQCKRDN